ncbi:MAG: GNAT family N-acetyltransferase [Nitrosospira sp.]|jgi:GNAT superfamily N-acetyltransferase|nr:GNAT family N-acetyltransferase [Nitrosospira sp.]
MLQEKLEFLRGPGGLRAAGFFGLKLLARIEVFRIVYRCMQPGGAPALPSGWRYLSLHDDEALSAMPEEILDQAAEQCGSHPREILGRKGSLHLLMIGDALAAQLTISRGPETRLDSPPLSLSMAATDAFLSYLYTWPDYRRLGVAKRLISSTVNDLAAHDIRRIIAHVRATNVPSLAAFEHAGWKSEASILCTLGGRLLMAPGAERSGLCFRSLA